MNPATDLWVYLSTSPLAWLALTLAAYVVADRIARRLNRHPLANPVVIAVVLVIIALQVSETPFETYFEGAQFVHFLLGPATVALAIPLVENWRRVKRSALPILIALVAGSVTAVGSAVGIGALLGASPPILASLAGKSVTTPIAMGIAEQLGGI
ncbi:MAG: LrgB family protein, partial [Bauldia litoralis]